jgi:hypothetical protein
MPTSKRQIAVQWLPADVFCDLADRSEPMCPARRSVAIGAVAISTVGGWQLGWLHG